MQPLGKSQVELLIGRQDFQDLMLNGAMKLWYRNINPSHHRLRRRSTPSRT